jgi:tripartite ATP-independent transporter DctP family solute receptor
MRGGMRSIARGLGLACAGALALAGEPSLARTFRAADTQAADYPTVQALRLMDQLVRERTGGRHSIDVFHSRQLGEEKETIEQTRVGAIDINRVNAAPLASFAPEANVLAIPFLFRSVEHLHRVLDGPIGEAILDSFGRHGFIGLAFYDSGARSIYNSLRPVRSPADLAGLRLRVQQSDVMVEMVRALGAEPVALPYGQVLTGLATRLVDGAENNWPSYVTTGHAKLAPFYSLTEHVMTPEVVVMSQRAWEALSPEDQAIFREAARESSRAMRAQWQQWEERARREAVSGGATMLTVDKASFEAAVGPMVEQLLSGPGMKTLVERIRETR